MYPLIHGSVLYVRAYYFSVWVTKQHPVNISFLKQLVQCIIETHSSTRTRTSTGILLWDITRVTMFYFDSKTARPIVLYNAMHSIIIYLLANLVVNTT